jgi:hypothetical protein
MGEFGLTYDIGSLYTAQFDTDWIWEAQALSDASSVTSDAFQAGGAQGALEIILRASSDMTVEDGSTLYVDLLYDTSETGDFADSKRLLSLAPSGSDTTYDDEDIIVRHIPAIDVDTYCKLKITNSGNMAAQSVDAWLGRVSR